MNRQVSSQPILCIDLKKKRIRIHKLTLHLLGDPDYIQLLVNPAEGIIAIRRSIPNDHLAHRVRLQELSDGTCCELYSTDLMQTLQQVNNEWKSNCSYRLYGNVNRKEGIAWFAMKNIVLVGDTYE